MKLILPVLLAAAVASAQTHQEQITVNVVEVPVYVSGLSGSSVAGLKKEDFELSVNGKPQPIEYFDVLDEEAAAAPVTSLSRRRLIVLLFDLSGPQSAHWRQKDQAKQFVESAAPGDSFAVATIGRKGLRVVVPFTDRAAVQSAISTLALRAARDPLNLATLAKGRSQGVDSATGTPVDIFGENPVIGISVQDSQSANPTPGTPAALPLSAAVGKLNKEETDAANRVFVDGLTRLAELLAPLTGVKHVLLLSGGPVADLNNLSFVEAVSRMHARYESAGVVLDVVDVVSQRAPSPRAPVFGSRASLYDLSIATGGAVMATAASLQKIHKITYILGFHPQGPQKRRNEIRVRVKNSGWGTSVRHRTSYSIEAKDGSGKGDGLFLADALVNDIAQNGLTVGVTVHAEHEKAELAASVPGRELLARPSDKPLLLDVFFYVFNDRNLVADWSYARISLDLDKGRDFLSSNPYTVRKQFDLPPGRYAAKALIRVVGTDVTGFRRADFQMLQP